MTFHKFLKINLILCTEGCFFVFQEAFDSNEMKLESVDKKFFLVLLAFVKGDTINSSEYLNL